MRNYLNLLAEILQYGRDHKTDRTGHGRRRLFSKKLEFDLSGGRFPLVTTRKIDPMKGVLEMLFFISGQTNVEWLQNKNCNIWNSWATTQEDGVKLIDKMVERGYASDVSKMHMFAAMMEDFRPGEIGPLYGCIWRSAPRLSQLTKMEMVRSVDDLPSDLIKQLNNHFSESEEFKKMTEEERTDFYLGNYYSAIDQLNELVCNLKKDPYSSRHLVTAYSPEFLPIPGFTPQENVLLGKSALMPCHHSFEVFVNPPEVEGGKPELSLNVNFRSWDVPLGGPTNIHGYAFLAHALAYVCDMEAVKLSINAADAHIYLDQIDGVLEQLARDPYEDKVTISFTGPKDLFMMNESEIVISEYKQHGKIDYPVAI